MKKMFILAAAVSLTALSANAQYYQQPHYQTVQQMLARQPQSQQQQYTPHAVCQSCYIRPYVGLDYSFNLVDWGKDEDGDDIDSYISDKLHAGSVSLGIKMHDNFALEAYYKKSAKAKKSDTLYGVPFTSELELQSFGVDAVFHSPRFGYENRVEFIGSAGVAWYELKAKLSVPGYGSESEKDNHVGFRAGAGLQYYLNDNLALRLMGRYNYTGIDNDEKLGEAENMFEVDAGVRYYF